ncbi:MAG: hypothetical protein EXS05_10505 [Planctomycetaceae bacterium]|nr:hypothetical protein [Planctomycetaceae bacterium]
MTQLRPRHILACCALTLLAAVYCARTKVRAETGLSGAAVSEAVSIGATFAQTWQQDGETVHLLHGQCLISQGETTMRAERAVVWRKADPSGAPGRERVSVYLEEGVRVDEPGSTLSERTLLLNLKTESGTTLKATRPSSGESAESDPTFVRARERRGHSKRDPIRRVQFPSEGGVSGPELRSVQLESPTGGVRRLRVFSRTGGSWDFQSFQSPDTTPPEQVLVFSGGINLLVDAVEQPGAAQPIGTIDLSADRVVIWTDAMSTRNFSGPGEALQGQDLPLQVYLEGNIVIRQGTYQLKASQAFYDVREQRAVLLNAELKAKIADAPAVVRVRAQQLRQTAENTFQAQQAWITTSEFGKPGYRLQASDIFIEPRLESPFNRSGANQFNPETGLVEADPTLWATTLNNSFFVEDMPLFYLPYLSVPAEDPNIPLRNINFQNDRIFGFQVRTVWDLFKLLGADRPEGSRWDLNLDYLTKRGPQIGTAGSYRGTDRFGLEGPYNGSGYATFIYDHGLDNLGQDRLTLVPAQAARGGLLVRDRQFFGNGLTWQGEGAFLSDRNWLEEYREVEFDNGKDYESLGYLKQQQGNWAWSALLRPRLYNYYNETAWLPRGDLFVLGEPLPGNLVTWTSHTWAGYADQKIASVPTDPHDKYSVLPFESNASGLAAATKHELDLPFDLGPGHIVPYALGEAAYWGDTATPDSPYVPVSTDHGSLGRLYGSLGVRGSLEFSKIFTDVHSEIFNLNGLAHKMVFDADFSYSQSTQSLNQVVPQFNEIDDNAQEQFRRRLFYNTWDKAVPAPFEPRSFALRSGVAQNVTAPYNEIVDDFEVLRLGWRHRLQTKVGPVNAPRIKNWMTLDLETSFFPNKDRDNFGEDFGLYNARYNWYVGDRTTITAGTLFDTFQNHETLWNLGFVSQRSARGSLYAGLRNIQGGSDLGPDLTTRILTASYSYILSPKWISTASTAYDLGQHQNRGQSLTLTRLGADFLVHFGFNIDTTRNNYGVGLSVEPRFAPQVGGFGSGGYGTQLGSLLSGAGK